MIVSKRQRLADTDALNDANSTADMLGVPVGAGPAEDTEQGFQSLFINATPRSATESSRRDFDDISSSLPHFSTIDSSAVTPSTRTMEAGKAETAKPQIDIPARGEKKRNKLANHEIKPSKQTLEAAAKETEEAADKKNEHHVIRGNVTPKERVMLLVYIVIAAVLAIAVIATGVSIASASAKASALAAEVAQKQATVATQQSDIADLTDIENIRERAIEELGMIYADETESVTVSAIDKVEYPEPTPHTNSFDGFCKWMSQIIA